MFRLIGTILKIAFVLLIVLLVIAFFTNPDIEGFKTEVRNQLNKKVNEQTDNPALSYIAELGTEFTDGIVEKFTNRKDYFICSVYTVDLPDGTYNYLGAFHTFFPLQEQNPLNTFEKP